MSKHKKEKQNKILKTLCITTMWNNSVVKKFNKTCKYQL